MSGMDSVEAWYLATCQDCTPVLPQPFTSEAERDEWAGVHRGATGHTVLTATEAPLVSGDVGLPAKAVQAAGGDAPGPASAKGVQVTCTDLDTGESETQVIWNDYVLVCAGSCYRHHVQAFGPRGGSTHVVTIKGRREP